MMSIIFLATCYYPAPLDALPEPAPGRAKISVSLAGGARLVFWVDKTQNKLAKIEASAVVDLSEIGIPSTIALSYWGGKWRWQKGARYGVGTRSNALVPGRTFANGWPGCRKLPYGTRIDLEDIPEELLPPEYRLRQAIYKGDSFGPHPQGMDDNKIDLFVGRPCQFKGTIRGTIRLPWRGVSRAAALGAQQALRIMGYALPRSTRSDGSLDGLWGAESQGRLDRWALRVDLTALVGTPIRPHAHILYWWIREHARLAREGGRS